MNNRRYARMKFSTKRNNDELNKKIIDFENTVAEQVKRIETEKREFELKLNQKFKLVTEAIRYMSNYLENGKPKDFDGLLRYYIAVGNFNAFYNNYDAAFSDAEQINNWIIHVETDFSSSIDWCMSLINPNDKLEQEKVYNLLSDEQSKDIYVRLIVWKILGFTKIKIISDEAVKEEEEFFSRMREYIVDSKDDISDSKFHLNFFNLEGIGYPINCYAIPESIVMDFLRNQYEYDYVKLEKGDYVIDCGACWGDTALLFSHRIKETGKVFSFEFVPSNIEIFNENMKENQQLATNIVLADYAVANTDYETFEYVDDGTSTSLCIEKDRVGTIQTAKTISIDEYIRANDIPKVDFIKMDIEGAEYDAIIGCEDTIRKFKPKLAISIYHRSRDIWEIPLKIKELCPEYKLYVKHNSKSSLETVLFAIV